MLIIISVFPHIIWYPIDIVSALLGAVHLRYFIQFALFCRCNVRLFVFLIELLIFCLTYPIPSAIINKQSKITANNSISRSGAAW